ncbi:hypothetical protein CLU79DRAFT_831575 [Phycomyces nitens]|nr:hypothetical protein CLU79DRAFT_831575 [Phycomyces nitens]
MDFTRELHREPIKRNNSERNKEWRDRFRQQCVDRARSSRQRRDDKRRGDTWVQAIVRQEWESFKKENEQAMLLEGVVITDLDIEEEILSHTSMSHDSLYEDFLWQEQNEIEAAVAMYEETQPQESLQYYANDQTNQCFNCGQFTLRLCIRPDQRRGVSCSNCNFNANEQVALIIQQNFQEHACVCPGRIGYMSEPGNEDMETFATSTDSLVLQGDSSKEWMSDDQELSQQNQIVIGGFHKFIESCRDNQDTQHVDKTHNKLLEHEREFVDILRVTLEKAESFCASSQYSLLGLVRNMLLGDLLDKGTDVSVGQKALDGLIKDFGWELFDYVNPFLISTNGSIEECSKVRKISSSILSHIGSVYSFRDLHMIVCERLSFIDWDSDLPDEKTCVKSAIQSVEIFKLLGKGMSHTKQCIFL